MAAELYWRDLRYAIRSLSRTPLFSVITVAILAVGIGANTAIFSLFDSIILHPSGFRDPARLVVPRVSYPGLNLQATSLSAPDFFDFEALHSLGLTA